MFSIYGLTGQVFSGTLEQLDQVRETAPVRRVRAVDEDGLDSGSSTLAGTRRSHYGIGPGTEAVREYAAASRADLERGPLYRAEQIMQRRVIALNADDDVARAWRTLSDNRIHQSPVLDAGHALLGFISRSDMLRAVIAEPPVSLWR